MIIQRRDCIIDLQLRKMVRDEIGESGYRPVEGKTGEKNTVCFGAGKILHDFLNGYADYDLAAKRLNWFLTTMKRRKMGDTSICLRT